MGVVGKFSQGEGTVLRPAVFAYANIPTMGYGSNGGAIRES
jgi:hypothetical protein